MLQKLNQLNIVPIFRVDLEAGYALEGGRGGIPHFLKNPPQMKCPRGDFYYRMCQRFFSRIQRSPPNFFQIPQKC